MAKCVYLIAFVMFLSPAVVYSWSPKEDFNNDGLITQAILDIQKMPREELDTFISYLASCESHNAGQVQEFFWQRERETYLIKYERGRAIDRVINVLFITVMWIESSDKVTKTGSKEKEEINKSLMRYVDIKRKLRDSANRRFRHLAIE